MQAHHPGPHHLPQPHVLRPHGGTDITNDGCIGPKSTVFYELRAKWGPSACTCSDGVQVGEPTPEMINEIVAAYAHVAGLVKWAGFELLNTNSINFPPSSPHKVR